MKKSPSINSPQNPNSLKKKLAYRFLKKLNKISSSSSSPSMLDKGKRRHAVRTAAYASMASAVGPRRAWSRALLKKIRNHSHRERKSRVRNPRNEDTRFGHEGILEDLSEVVPGGEAMDSCSLLNETSHYIKCLRAQVQIMREILHYSSS